MTPTAPFAGLGRGQPAHRAAGPAANPAGDVAGGAGLEGAGDLAGPAVALIGEPLAEAAVLGCLLRGTPAQGRALLRRLTESDWSVPQHAHVAAAARMLLERNEPVDPVTVLGQLRRQGTEDARTSSTSTAVLLVELCQAAPCPASAGHYLQIVLEHSYRRRVQQAGLRLLQAADTAALPELAQLTAAEHAAVTRAHARAAAPPA